MLSASHPFVPTSAGASRLSQPVQKWKGADEHVPRDIAWGCQLAGIASHRRFGLRQRLDQGSTGAKSWLVGIIEEQFSPAFLFI